MMTNGLKNCPTYQKNSPGTPPHQELRGSIGWSMSAKSFVNLLLRPPAKTLSKNDHDDQDLYLAMADDDDGDDQGQDDEGGEDADGDHRARVHLSVLLPVQRSPSLYVPNHKGFDFDEWQTLSFLTILINLLFLFMI